MARKKQKKTPKASSKRSKSGGLGIVKLLEAIVVIGAVAAALKKIFAREKDRK
jgi:hypothetical protein